MKYIFIVLLHSDVYDNIVLSKKQSIRMNQCQKIFFNQNGMIDFNHCKFVPVCIIQRADKILFGETQWSLAHSKFVYSTSSHNFHMNIIN